MNLSPHLPALALALFAAPSALAEGPRVCLSAVAGEELDAAVVASLRQRLVVELGKAGALATYPSPKPGDFEVYWCRSASDIDLALSAVAVHAGDSVGVSLHLYRPDGTEAYAETITGELDGFPGNLQLAETLRAQWLEHQAPPPPPTSTAPGSSAVVDLPTTPYNNGADAATEPQPPPPPPEPPPTTQVVTEHGFASHVPWIAAAGGMSAVFLVGWVGAGSVAILLDNDLRGRCPPRGGTYICTEDLRPQWILTMSLAYGATALLVAGGASGIAAGAITAVGVADSFAE